MKKRNLKKVAEFAVPERQGQEYFSNIPEKNTTVPVFDDRSRFSRIFTNAIG